MTTAHILEPGGCSLRSLCSLLALARSRCKPESVNVNVQIKLANVHQHASTCIKTQKQPAINQAARNQDVQRELEKEEHELEKVRGLHRWVVSLRLAGVNFDKYLLDALSQLCFFKFEAAEHMVDRVLGAMRTEPVRDPSRYFRTAVTQERLKYNLWR